MSYYYQTDRSDYRSPMREPYRRTGTNTVSNTYPRKKRRRKRASFIVSLLPSFIVLILLFMISYYIGVHIVNVIDRVFGNEKVNTQTYLGIEDSNAEIVPMDEILFEETMRTITAVEWMTFSEERKLEILQLIVDYETQNILGCSTTKVCADELSEIVAGNYSGIITIKRELLRDAPLVETVRVTLHEVRHHYQQYVAQVMSIASKNAAESEKLDIFREANIFLESLRNYTPYDGENIEEYDNQPIELDADAYANKRVKEFYGILENWTRWAG